ncbi:MAG: mechanosensitive ion channel, partial [Eubacterium sp.]|nr:mechanosensitive ion channel [Eubacterium sp.]
MIEERFEEVKEYFTSFLPRGVHFLIALAGALVIIVAGFRLIKFITGKIKKSMLKKGAEPGVVSFLISAIKLLLEIFVVVVAAQVLGLETSSVVALVGSAGLAIGLALQGSLANFAGGVLILLMKPFCVGDYIVVGDVEGWVKKID